MLGEVVPPFLAALLFLIQLFFVARLLSQADVIFGSAGRLGDVGRILFYLLPSTLSYGLPVAFLLGILIGLGRLGDDRELTALAATGHGPTALLPTPLMIGALLTVVMLSITFWFEPVGIKNVRALMDDIIKRNLAGDVKEGTFYEDLSDLTVFAGKVDKLTGKLTHVLVEDAREPRSPILVLAHEGRIVDEQGALVLGLSKGELHRSKPSDEAYAVATFDHANVAVISGSEISRKNRMRRPFEDLTPRELLDGAHWWADKGKERRDYWIEFHHRIAHPFVMLALAVVGVAVAGSPTGRRQSGRAMALAWTLGSVVGYFVLGKVFTTFGNRGLVPPLLAAWAPVFVIAAVGGGLLWWKRERGGAS